MLPNNLTGVLDLRVGACLGASYNENTGIMTNSLEGQSLDKYHQCLILNLIDPGMTLTTCPRA